MAWTNAKTAIITTIGVILATGVATVTVKKIEAYRAADWHNLDESFWRLDSRVLNKAPEVCALRPSKGGGGNISSPTRMVALHVPLGSLLYYAYATNNIYYQFGQEYQRHRCIPAFQMRFYDLPLDTAQSRAGSPASRKSKNNSASSPASNRAKPTLFSLKSSNPAAPRLTPTRGNGSIHFNRGKFDFTNQPIFMPTDQFSGKPVSANFVVDQTGLPDHYTGELSWTPQPDSNT